jgi:hypothetical protein
MKPPPDVQRIKPFFLLLASDQSGEVAAAAAALVRVLKSTGHDLHDLYQLIVSASTPVPIKESESPRPGCCLNPKERTFVNQMTRWRREPSEDQRNWLQDIFEKHCGVLRLSEAYPTAAVQCHKMK